MADFTGIVGVFDMLMFGWGADLVKKLELVVLWGFI